MSMVPYAVSAQFSEDAVEQQLDKIFLHPDFSNSEILRKFLKFVVRETFNGNADRLKEYTIAVKALEKPSTFNPQKNCIVRIHACRLRRALYHYYSEINFSDEIIIGMPKGKYVPVFMDREQWLSEKKQSAPSYVYTHKQNPKDAITLAILPFNSTSVDSKEKPFSETLCLQICSTLSQAGNVSIIGYQMIKSLIAKQFDIKELGALLGLDHVICGDSQILNSKVRVNLQIIDCQSYQQIWSRIFESRLTDTNMFDIQDEICRNISNVAIGLIPTARS
jgi:TolB-like protein